MKVVFLQDVPNVASAGDVKEVADGYARNFLIPRKLAALASSQAMSQAVTSEKVKAKTDTELVELAGRLDGQEVKLKAHAGAKDRLYGSITSADIAAELEKVTKITVDKRKIELEEPIRQLGDYEVVIRLGKDIMPKIKVSVTEEEEAAKEEKKKPAKKAAKTKKAEAEPKKAAKKTTKAAAKKETKAKAAPKKAAKTTKAPKEKKATETKKAAEKKAAPKKKTTTKTTKAKKTEKKEES
jgi:large subunit ribosomal protein L9